MVKFNKYDFKDWEKFRLSKKSTISREEFEMVCNLHRKIYGHNLPNPCTCNPKQINKWIQELNIVWNNGD
jgi:hypothetical protein